MDDTHSRIFKYSLEPDRRQLVMMPASAKILSVNEVNIELCLYAEVECGEDNKPIGPLVPRVFVVVTTGDSFNSEGKTYIGTTILGEWFVAHVYEQASGYQDPIDHRNREDFAQIKAEMSEPKPT